jgi:F0F1-type ATP synthase membrane subunit b/b'
VFGTPAYTFFTRREKMIADLQRQLGIDASFFTQFLVFIFVFLWLQLVYFKPFLALIQLRQCRSGGLNEDSLKREEAAKRAEQDYKDALSVARKKAAQERDRVLLGARAQAAEAVGVARQQAKARLEQSREASARAAELDLNGLKSQVGSVASLLIERLTKARVGL